jgi:hypothetical protein
MLKAIINSDYQIIREKVIINRHKTKNLKQALELESKILGEPITLEDILVLLTKNGGQYSHQALKWQLRKPLHAQKLEVWELIAEEIKELEKEIEFSFINKLEGK